VAVVESFDFITVKKTHTLPTELYNIAILLQVFGIEMHQGHDWDGKTRLRRH